MLASAWLTGANYRVANSLYWSPMLLKALSYYQLANCHSDAQHILLELWLCQAEVLLVSPFPECCGPSIHATRAEAVVCMLQQCKASLGMLSFDCIAGTR